MELTWLSLITNEIVLVSILIAGTTFFVSKSLIKVQRLIAGEVKDYLQVALSEHREAAVEKVGHHVGSQLEGLKEDLKDALADKIIAEKATIIAEEAQVVAEEESDSKTQFLSRMSHEIRTPMSGIISSLDLIDLDTVTETQAEDIQRAVDSSNRLLGVVNEILTFNSTKSGEVTYECEEFNLSGFCHEMINSLRSLAEQKNLKLSLNIDGLQNIMRHGDEQKIHQVLTNLLGNAIKFTEQGEVRLEVEEYEDSWVHFQVMDTGVGIDEDKLESLFDPFYQVDESNTRRHGGTGLGLAISKKFAEGMGGSIFAESTPGEGSCFQFKIQLCDTDCNKISCKLTRKEKGKPNPTLLTDTHSTNAKLKILVVDDDDVNRMVAKRCLSDICSVLDEAKDGKEALSMFQDKFYHLVLMDIQMPVMDGFEAYREMRKYEREFDLDKTPVVAVSASVVGDIVDECETVGMDGYISKPFKKDTLVEEVTNTINNFIQS